MSLVEIHGVLSMRATVDPAARAADGTTSVLFPAKPGQTIEVVGFVHHTAMTWALWRDDEGRIWEIPTWAIRMQPAVAEVAAR